MRSVIAATRRVRILNSHDDHGGIELFACSIATVTSFLDFRKNRLELVQLVSCLLFFDDFRTFLPLANGSNDVQSDDQKKKRTDQTTQYDHLFTTRRF